MKRLLLLLLLMSAPVWAAPADPDSKRYPHFEREPPSVAHPVIAMRENFWMLAQTARRGDLQATQLLVDRAWKLWLAIDEDLRARIKQAYPRIERQMDDLREEALGMASQANAPAAVDKDGHPIEADLFPGYRDQFDLFGNCGLGNLHK